MLMVSYPGQLDTTLMKQIFGTVCPVAKMALFRLTCMSADVKGIPTYSRLLNLKTCFGCATPIVSYKISE